MTLPNQRARQRAGGLVRAATLAGAASCLLASATLAAENCPGNPDALGTSRTLVVDPREYPRIGTMQYAQTLPLRDREVVLTFDDGPVPRHTNVVLDLLKAECVKATFFVVGEMARAHPDGVRRMRDEGHTIGTHSHSHPLSMHKMPLEQARAQIEEGIAHTTAALGEAPAPFFRIPGLLRADAVEGYLEGQGLQTWSADFPADDWHKITPEKVHELAMSRLAARGKGMILLHDIQSRTAGALPAILRDLKAGGYRIVHVVPASPDQPKTPTEPQQWRERGTSDMVAMRRWPAVPRFVYADNAMLPAPALAMAAPDGVPLALPRHRSRQVASADAVPIRYAALGNSVSLAAPASSLFAQPEKSAPNYRIAIAVARPVAPLPEMIASAQAQTNTDGKADDIGKLIAATDDPVFTGSIASTARRN